MKILYMFESVRFPILNEFMLLITTFGEETVFLVTALIIFWCVDKYRGYYVLSVGFIGTITNQFLKLWFRIPRPWVMDDNFTILEQARDAASGYSFPSGHTQSAIGTFGAIAYTEKRCWIRAAAIAIAIFVPLSRMYIGVHTLLDVTIAALISLILVIVLKQIVFGFGKNTFIYLLSFMIVLSVGFLCFVEFYPFPSDIDMHNYESGLSNAYTLLGSLLGFLVVYIADEKWLNFSVKAVWWAQLIKIVVGLCLVFAVKSGLKTPLNAFLGEYLGRCARYFLLVITAGIVWPLSFKWFAKLGTKVK